eukprot:ctg_2773.g553
MPPPAHAVLGVASAGVGGGGVGGAGRLGRCRRFRGEIGLGIGHERSRKKCLLVRDVCDGRRAARNGFVGGGFGLGRGARRGRQLTRRPKQCPRRFDVSERPQRQAQHREDERRESGGATRSHAPGGYLVGDGSALAGDEGRGRSNYSGYLPREYEEIWRNGLFAAARA